MIERNEVDGRPCMVAYIKDDFEPCDKDEATLAKVIFDDDGSSLWLSMREPEPDDDEEEKAEPESGKAEDSVYRRPGFRLHIHRD